MRSYISINGIEGVSPNGTAVATIPPNRRYHTISLFVGDSGSPDSSKVSLVRLFVNGVLIREVTPAQIIALAKMRLNLTPDAGYLPLIFSDPNRATVIGEEVTALDLFGQNKCTVEVVFSGATSPTLAIQGTYDLDRNLAGGQPVLAIVKQRVLTTNAAVGDTYVTTIPNQFPIQSLLLQPSAGTISRVEVWRGSDKVFEASKAQNNADLDLYEIDPTAFEFPVVFDREHQVTSALDCANRNSKGEVTDYADLTIKVTCSASNNLAVLFEQRVDSYR